MRPLAGVGSSILAGEHTYFVAVLVKTRATGLSPRYELVRTPK